MASVLIAGLFGLWMYVTLNMPSAPRPLLWLRRSLLRLPKGGKLVHCPWCLGFWTAGPAYMALGDLSLLATPVGYIAAAGVTGLLGAFVGTDDE